MTKHTGDFHSKGYLMLHHVAGATIQVVYLVSCLISQLYCFLCRYLYLSLGEVPWGFWGSGENGYLFSGSLGAMIIIFRDLGSKLIV